MKKIFGEKGILNGKRVLTATLVIVLLSGITLYSVAAGHTWKSQGNIAAVRSDGTKTVIFDKSDLDYLDGRIDAIEADVSTGKENLANALNPLGTNPSLGTPLSGTSTFNELMEAINHSQAIPDKTIGESVSIATEDYELASKVTGQTINSDTKISAATADNLSLGTSAWVDGSLLIGTSADNKNYYNKAYTQGIADGLSKVNVSYVYHKHIDGNGNLSSSVLYTTTDPGGCYVSAGHTHNKTGTCGTAYSYQSHDAWGRITDNYSGSAAHQVCKGCGRGGYSWDNFNWGAQCPTPVGSYYTCGNQINTWKIGCGKTENSIEQAIIHFN